MTRRTKLLLLIPVLAVSLPVLLALASRSEPDRVTNTLAGPDPLQSSTGLAPRVSIDETTYNFGILDPLTESTHSFTIRNAGQAPLELALVSTTCKCTLGEITQPVVPPGESGQIRLAWNTGSKYTFYSHGATIRTNDPLRNTLDLRIQGTVRVQLGAVTPELLLDGVEPDKSKSVSTWLYSQTWDDFAVQKVDCSRDDIQWKIEAVDLAEAPQLKAKSACRLTVTAPAGMPEGYFQELLTCLVQPKSADPATLELTLAGKVLRRLSLYGPGMDHLGELNLGNIPAGEALHRRLVLKVRDPQPDLQIRSIQANPAFLDVQLTPYQTEAQATGLYHLDVRLPASSPRGDYQGVRKGSIKLSLEHPRISDLELPVSFAIIPGR